MRKVMLMQAGYISDKGHIVTKTSTDIQISFLSVFGCAYQHASQSEVLSTYQSPIKKGWLERRISNDFSERKLSRGNSAASSAQCSVFIWPLATFLIHCSAEHFISNPGWVFNLKQIWFPMACVVQVFDRQLALRGGYYGFSSGYY